MRTVLTNSTLFLVAGVQYVYVTYLGYSALPFIVRSELLLAPLLPILGGYVRLSLPAGDRETCRVKPELTRSGIC
jgi:hypothetical protein